MKSTAHRPPTHDATAMLPSPEASGPTHESGRYGQVAPGRQHAGQLELAAGAASGQLGLGAGFSANRHTPRVQRATLVPQASKEQLVPSGCRHSSASRGAAVGQVARPTVPLLVPVSGPSSTSGADPSQAATPARGTSIQASTNAMWWVRAFTSGRIEL